MARGRKGYGPDVKLRAKALWIVGNMTDQQIADAVGISRSETIGDWRRSESWEKERAIIQQETDRRVSQAVAETISEMNSRHLRQYQLLQSKGLAALKRFDPKSATEAQAMMDIGIKGERLVRGEPTEVREVRALMQTNVQILEVVVADVIRALLDSGQIDGRAARQFAEMFAAQINEAPFRYRVDG